jgi:hypothetical protein
VLPALCGPTRSSPPGSTQPTEPPPAPIERTSTQLDWTGNPAAEPSGSTGTAPSSTRQVSKLVPPTSAQMASSRPSSRASRATASAPATGPEKIASNGASSASSNDIVPPPERMISSAAPSLRARRSAPSARR